MARFDDLDQYFAPGLTLTVRGREYQVPLPSAELGLWCQRIAQAAGAMHSAETTDEIRDAVGRLQALPELDGDLTLPQRVLGPVYDQMVADEVPFPHIEVCGETAYVWIINGEDAALRYWTSGGRPEARGPDNRAARRAARSTGTGGAGTTRSRTSTSGTTSRPKKPTTAGRRSRGSSS